MKKSTMPFLLSLCVILVPNSQLIADSIYVLDRITTGSASEITRMDLDGSNQILIHTGPLAGDGIAANDSFLYWGDATGIQRSNFDGSGATTLVPGQGGPLDVTNDFIYLAKGINAGSRIDRLNVDGTGLTTLFSPTAGNGIDVTDSFLYWTTNEVGFVDGVVRSALDGTGAAFIAGGSAGAGLGISVTDTHIFWSGSGTLFRTNLDGSGATSLITGGVGRIEATDSFVYYASGDRIRRANLDGTGIVDIATGFDSIQDLAIVPAVIPEPASYALFIIAIALTGARYRRCSRS